MNNLVSTQWLADALGSSDLVVLDASAHLPDAKRDASGEFSEAHIPGARFLDLASLFDAASPVPNAVPTGEQFAERMQALGVASGSRIIVYDDSYVKTAARAWFIGRLCGVENIAVLDGGLGKWRAEDRALEGGWLEYDAAQYTAASGAGELRSKDQVLANITQQAEQLVDARGAKRFTGEEGDFRPNIASGHIPGARNVVFDQVHNADGTYKNADEIRAAFAATGVDLDRPVVTTCGGGVTAAVLLFALHLAGKRDVALYDGSWSEWGSDAALPTEMGEAV